jgi:hypothetical protein
MVKSQKMTYQDWPKPDLRQAGISQAPEHQFYHDLVSPASQFLISKEDLMKPAA